MAFCIALLLLVVLAARSDEPATTPEATTAAATPVAAVDSEGESTATNEVDNPDGTTAAEDDPIRTPTAGLEATEEAGAPLSKLVDMGGRNRGSFPSAPGTTTPVG